MTFPIEAGGGFDPPCKATDGCAFCARVDAWARAHCYRCDVAVTETGAEYRLCDACLAHLGLTAQPTEPEVYWRARSDAAPPMPPIARNR